MPGSRTTDLLCRFLREVVNATESASGEICLKSSEETQRVQMIAGGLCIRSVNPLITDWLECATFLKDRPDPIVVTALNGETPCARFIARAESCLLTPLRYQGLVVGLMALTRQRPGEYKKPHVDLCRWIGSEIIYQVKRYEFNDAVRAALGEDMMLIGRSSALRNVDEFIERASPAGLPALITGEFGSEKRQVAYALHFCGRSEYPFVEVKCATLDAQMVKQTVSSQLRRADGGTIFFDGIDEMEYDVQCRLSEIIDRETGASASRNSRSAQVRLVASARRGMDSGPEERSTCGPLLEKFDFLIAQVAPLRERREDIKPLGEYFLSKHTNRPHRAFSTEVAEVLEAYDWPKNVYELERVVARLAILSEESVISTQDLYRHAPGLARVLGGSSGPPPPVDQQHRHPGARPKRPGATSQVNMRLLQLADELIKGDLSEANRLHPGLQTALKYVAQNIHEVISLRELARHAGVSTSHLAYLFKKSLGVNFKLFLAILRVEEAKQLLTEKPHMGVTEISFQVGFGDLRHFERTFKRLVGRTPRDYRHLRLGQA